MSGEGARAVRELGQALHSGPFRVALVLSLIVHLVLLAVLGWGGPGREGQGERRIRLMRVQLLRPPPEVPAPPVVQPPAPARAIEARVRE